MAERRLILLALAALAACVAFMAIGLRGNLAFALELRATRLLALAQVGVAIAVSTLLFQTVTANILLTPSIMGLDALYLLGQTLLVFVLGGIGYALLDPRLKFVAEVGLLMLLALALFLPLLRQRVDVNLLLLAGVVAGILFRSLTALLSRLLDPNAFSVVQVASVASFNVVRPDLLAVGLVVTTVGAMLAWRMRHTLDVVSLGPDIAAGLGVERGPVIAGVMLLVAALVAVSTALVGPVAFLGLLVVALAEWIVGTRRHHLLLPASIATALIILVGGQTVLQHGLGGATSLGIVVEFLGGLVFVVLLLARSRR